MYLYRRILLACVHEQTGPPLYGVLCLDWIKWEGIPENAFSHLLHEQEDERNVLLTKHSTVTNSSFNRNMK